MFLVTKPSANDVILNSTNYVGSYVPKTLTLIQDVDRLKYAMYIRYDAYKALLKMFQAAKKDHVAFIVYQAYTSYKELSSDAKGHNEFQLGLSVSLTSQGVPYKHFSNCTASKWLLKNSYKYGFILRYPKSKTTATRHSYDAHIYRYVTTTTAKKMHDQDLTMEEMQKNKLKSQSGGD
jgi:LAS superfamily LD-carboxypeptidase LdcB